MEGMDEVCYFKNMINAGGEPEASSVQELGVAERRVGKCFSF